MQCFLATATFLAKEKTLTYGLKKCWGLLQNIGLAVYIIYSFRYGGGRVETHYKEFGY